MSFEPEKFFIGLMDFFSILLPGAMLTYFLQGEAGPVFLPEYARLAGTEKWILFLFSSYLLGHFIFLVGSWIDDAVYDPFRKGTYHQQIDKLAEGQMLSFPWTQWVGRRFFGKDDQPLRQVLIIKNRYIDPDRASGAVNAFQWSKARLTLDHPSAIATVLRFEADSKFFRSLVVVLMVLIVTKGRSSPVILVSCVAGIVLALSRYVDQRRKSINQAYFYVMTIEAAKGAAAVKPLEQPPPSASHAGGVVYREDLGGRQYLLVETSKEPKRWVLPKGHIEAGEKPNQTAVREVREETGAWARVEDKLGEASYVADFQQVKAQFFLMELLEEGEPDERRKILWMRSTDSAKRETLHSETKDVLNRADDYFIRKHRA